MRATSVLFVEDEYFVMIEGVEALEAAGFHVITAHNGARALLMMQGEDADAIAVLVTDIRLGPGPDGWHVARVAREINPDLAVIYSTASSRAEWASKGVPESVYLGKPVTPEALLAAVLSLTGANI